MSRSSDARLDQAALAVLVVLQGLMLAALYTGTPPHPPRAIPLFALGPFLSAAIALAVAALMLGARATRAGRIVGLAAAAAALVSFGPQKWLDPTFAEIWPAVVLAQAASLALIGRGLGLWPRRLDQPRGDDGTPPGSVRS